MAAAATAKSSGGGSPLDYPPKLSVVSECNELAPLFWQKSNVELKEGRLVIGKLLDPCRLIGRSQSSRHLIGPR